MRQAAAILAACCAASAGCSGWQRWQGRKPACSASAPLAWKRTFSGRARRDGQDGRQYTPVERTE
ncbi:hypothetical protein D3C78_1675490 [compost metagenome]